MNIKTFNLKEFLYFGLPMTLGDLVIYVAVHLVLARYFQFDLPEDEILRDPKCLFILVLGFFLAKALAPSRIYERDFSWKEQIVKIFVQATITLGVLAVSVDLLFYSFAGFFYMYEGFLVFGLLLIWHFIFRAAILKARKLGRNKVHVVIVGGNESAQRLQDTFSNDSLYGDYKLVACLGDNPDEIDRFITENKVHQLYCCLNPAVQTETVNRIIRSCENRFVDFFYVPYMEGYLRHSVSFQELDTMPVLKLREEPLSNPLNAAVKRVMDVVVSFLFLVCIYPFVWCFVAIGTSLSSPGPILFKQKRTGYKGKPFILYKFRSMRVNADSDKLQATAGDPRKTRFGDFLRRSSIDEIPQFINVFKGDMSLVGPRPHMELHTEMYSKIIDEYLVRHMVKPGITGWAQVNGCRGETPNPEMMAERVRHDIWYLEHWSLGLDFKIIGKTILQILKGDEQAY